MYLDFGPAIKRLGENVIRERYGNLFEMYDRITDENPYKLPMRIYPAVHYTMGGLWVDYELMTTDPRPVLRWARPTSPTTAPTAWAPRRSCRAWPTATSCCRTRSPTTWPAARQGRAADRPPGVHRQRGAEAKARYDGYLATKGTRSVDWFHRELGKIMWDYCGMERTETGLEKALGEIPALHEEFKRNVRVPGQRRPLNQSLEKAGRVDDFFELGLLMCKDALVREESCGGHFRAEHQYDDGEAKRDDENFAHVTAWEWGGDAGRIEHREPLEFEDVHLAVGPTSEVTDSSRRAELQLGARAVRRATRSNDLSSHLMKI